MKKWTQRQAMKGLSVTPDLLNTEIRAQQSSITTLDRAQIPANFVAADRLKDNALVQVWQDRQVGATGEQETYRDSNVQNSAWISTTLQVQPGGWSNVTTNPLVLQGFKGGNLFFEWSCNAYVNNIFAGGLNDGSPGSPNYMRLRIVVNGVTLCERRGAAYHQTTRLVIASDFPPGDLTVQLQWRLTSASEDAASVVDGGEHLPYGHLWNNRYFAIGRYR
jgi:hypothetical protein